MTRGLIFWLLWAAACAAQAQWPSEAERQAQSSRLDMRRQQLEDSYNQDMRLCYQQFNVTSCRLQARDRRIEANVELRKEELALKDLERRIKAAQRMADRNNEAQQQQAQREREQAVQNAQEREQRQAEKQAEHDAKGGEREAYERKQREAQAHRDNLEKKRRERDKPPAAPLPVPGASR